MLNDFKIKLVTILLLLTVANEILCFKIPDVTFLMNNDGFSLSIPDQDGIVRVDFQVMRNRPFFQYTQGDLSKAATLEGSVWIARFDTRLTFDDLLYVWYNVQHGQVLYRKLQNEPINVRLSHDSSAAKKNVPAITKGGTYKDELLFEDDFNSFNEKVWQKEFRFPPEDGDNEFTGYYDMPTPVNNGAITLQLQPFLNFSRYRKDAIYDLGSDCSFYINRQQQCKVVTGVISDLRKWGSPRINTRNSFSFTYGKVEIRAKFPKGDWIVPTMVLEPVAKTSRSYELGQLRIGFIRGNEQTIDYKGHRLDGCSLFGGAVVSSDSDARFMNLVNKVENHHFGDDFHVYRMIWTKTNITFEVDDEPYGTIALPINGNSDFAFDTERYIALGISAGGFADFPMREKIWTDLDPRAVLKFQKNDSLWLPSWKSPELVVDYVRVYAV